MNKKIFLYSIFFVSFLILSQSIFAENSEIEKYFSDEIKSVDYGIKVDYAKLKIHSVFGKVSLKLKHYELTELYKNIYKLTLYFKRKKGIFNYHNKLELYFFYNKKIIVFKTTKGKKRYSINLSSQIYIEKKDNNQFLLLRKPVKYSFKLPVKNGKLYITLVFYYQ